ncbi:MAG: Hpt domain-containing protein [Gallionella sp.]
MNNPAQFDRAALNIVRPGIDGGLSQLNHALEKFWAFPASEAASLQIAQEEIKRLIGVFKMVGLDGLAVYCSELEVVFAELSQHPTMITAVHRDAVDSALQALDQYLHDIARGGDNASTRLFSRYQQLQHVRGLEMSFELDLFFPNLNVSLPGSLLDVPQAANSPAQIKLARSQYQQSLLRYLRHIDVAQSLTTMRQAMHSVMTALPADKNRVYWWVCAGFFDCLGGQSHTTVDVNAPKLLGKIDQQMRMLMAGQSLEEQPELNQMLYVIAYTEVPSGSLAAEIQETFVLDRYVHAANDVPISLLSKRLSVIAEHLRTAQDSWNSCVLGNQADCINFVAQAGLIESYCEKLDQDAVKVLARTIATYAQYAVEPDTAEALAMDMAMSLLLLDRGIAHYHEIDASFQQQALVLADRMHEAATSPSENERPIGELIALHYAQEKSGISAILCKEMLANLQRVETGLNAFFQDNAKRHELQRLSQDIRQIRGGLHMLGWQSAASLSDAFQLTVEYFVTNDKPVERSESRAVASALSVLESCLTHGGTLMNSDQEDTFKTATSALAKINQGAKLQDISATMPVYKVETVGTSSEDMELIDIFLEEAGEVLSIMRENLELSHLNKNNSEPLITIRRGFHTLKGSGRMVGLNDLGEVAWALERAMNVWLKAERPASKALTNMIAMAIPIFSNWVEKLRRSGSVRIEADELIRAARRIEENQAEEEIEETPLKVEHDASALALIDESVALETAPVQPEKTPSSAAETEASGMVQIGAISLSAALFKIGSEESRQHVSTLQAQLAELHETAETRIEYDFMRAAHTLAGVNRAMGFTAIVDLAFALECWLQMRMEHPFNLQHGQLELIQNAVNTLDRMVQDLCARQFPRASSDLVYLLNMDKDKLHVDEVVNHDELHLEEFDVQPKPVGEIPIYVVPAAFTEFLAAPIVFDTPATADISKVAPEPVLAKSASLAQTENVASPAAVEIAPTPAVSAHTSQSALIRDDVDEQLFPVFLEEADELIPQLASNLRTWRAHPADDASARLLNRLLHTLKGSARMAGAMRIGQVAHEMEDAVLAAAKRQHEATYWDELDHQFDRISALLEELRTGKPPQEIADVRQRATDHQRGEFTQDRRMLEIGAERALQGSMLRVRADVIDRLVNEASEISVARARIESELRSFKDSLLELTESVMHLRKQLREVEIQAESQMQARVSQAQDNDLQFDPLELDRFTRLQELTRFMNESVHDVQTVQHTLLKNLDEANAAMMAQARLNRELQQSLMNVRMVPFNSITDRLYRIVRQTGKELNKRANLELAGTSVELDRSVLEKMTAPFEHLLRNAMAHGLENEQQRNQLGKQPIGEIRLSLRQENNEVVFELSDDGAGLNFAALRERAIALGVLQADDTSSEEQLAQLIFTSGISTASEVTEVAGRGIGMDVVRSEITGLGGRVDVSSHSEKGTRFIIHLPLTLAVTQVLMVRSGDTTYAIPAGMVEEVRQLKSMEIEELYRARQIEWRGKIYPLHHLSQLLGERDSIPDSQARNSVLLLRSGDAGMALHIEELLGNQETVVKNIGPQLARLPGIAGATVQANGKVVLILNPLHISQKMSAQSANKQTISTEVALNKLPLVMVVDDSLTVRKITTRMLTRVGYDVITAKDGVDALEQLANIMPSAMLLDVEMPRMDGFELTKRLRQDEKTKDLPIIMITSRTADKHRDHALQLGVNAYLGKPYQEDELLNRLAEFTAVRQ